MQSVCDSTRQIVVIRLKAMKALKWLSKQDMELELAASEIEEAIESLSRTEVAMGNAHHNLLVSQATLQARAEENDCAET